MFASFAVRAPLTPCRFSLLPAGSVRAQGDFCAKLTALRDHLLNRFDEISRKAERGAPGSAEHWARTGKPLMFWRQSFFCLPSFRMPASAGRPCAWFPLFARRRGKTAALARPVFLLRRAAA